MNYKINPTAETKGTSFHCVGIVATANQLIEKFGPPHLEFDGSDEKVTKEWIFEDDSGLVFTIYDWKCRTPDNELCYWHIGGHGELQEIEFSKWITLQLTLS